MMKILFMGTPDFAASILNSLLDGGFSVPAVISQPDRPKGRGHKTVPTEVKAAAMAANIPVYQSETLKNGALMPLLDEIKPDVIVVAAYGKILPEYILNYPKYGCINVHASLLPKYRGAAPIQRAVINGDTKTGITIMKMEKGLDTGDIISQTETEIGEYETAGELFDRLAKIGGELLTKTLHDIENGTATARPQRDSDSSYAPMLTREDGVIDWNKSAREISKLICGLNPWPLAHTNYNGGTLKISAARVSADTSDKTPGTILSLDKGKGLKIACGDGTLYITEAQFPESRRMNVEDYARGHKIITHEK